MRALLHPHPAQLLMMDVFLVTCLCFIPFMESYVKCKTSFYFILSTRGRQTTGEVQSCFDIHHQLIRIDLECISTRTSVHAGLNHIDVHVEANFLEVTLLSSSKQCLSPAKKKPPRALAAKSPFTYYFA